MTLFPYNTNIPASGNNPSADQPNMEINTNSINGIIGVDHVGFNLSNGGYHTVIHQPNQTIGGQTAWNPVGVSGVPAAVQGTKISGVQQLFSMLYTPNYSGATADTQLFSLTGNGGISQLTGNNSASNGWAWLGGILIQWGNNTSVSSGSFATGSASGTVTFTSRANCIPFPNNCFMVTPVPFWVNSPGAPSGAGSVNINQTTLSATSFDWQFNSNSGNYRGFYWFAIGN